MNPYRSSSQKEKTRRYRRTLSVAILLTLIMQLLGGPSYAHKRKAARKGGPSATGALQLVKSPKLPRLIRDLPKQISQIDQEIRCLEPVPDEKGFLGSLNDDGSEVPLNVHVIVDGDFSDEELGTIWSKVPLAYKDPGLLISLNSPLERVNFDTKDALELLKEAKKLHKGQRPASSDLVYVVTDKDIEIMGDNAIAGLADCVGGVRFPHRAFAVGEGKQHGTDGEEFKIEDFGAKIAAHEIGHLMGGHHHYANCVEAEDLLEAFPSCTLMFNAVNFATLRFSSLNREVVRQHGAFYAR